MQFYRSAKHSILLRNSIDNLMINASIPVNPENGARTNEKIPDINHIMPGQYAIGIG